MPRFPSIPQLSIVIPVTNDMAAFEASLVSVLENRPERCELIVPHDGGYDDPFDLGDEVRFVDAASGSLVDQVNQGAQQARGRFLHVVAEGVLATAGWTDAAMELLNDPDIGCVAPTIRETFETADGLGDIVACGWSDTPSRLCDPLAAGSDAPSRREIANFGGPYLQASFWRRDLFCSLASAFRGTDATEASYSYGLLTKLAGWNSEIAVDSVMAYDDCLLSWDQSNLDRGRRLRAIRHQLINGGWGTALTAGLRSLAACLAGQVSMGEAIGQATAPLAAAEIELLLFAGETIAANEYDNQTIGLPVRSQQATRRAA